MIRHIILDAGGVIVYPRLGDWNIPYGAPAILGERARDIATSKYLIAHQQSARWLAEDQLLPTVEDERRVRRAYIRQMNTLMGWNLSDADVLRLGDDFTDNISRYGMYNDVLPWLKRWQGKYSLSVLSDTLPSLDEFLQRFGIRDCLTARVYSCQVGALKPDGRMYAAALSALGARADECLFVDDRPENLEGAEAVGMTAVQMARRETPPARVWDGPVVHAFEELDRHVQSLNG